MTNLQFINSYSRKATAYLFFCVLSPCILLAQDWESSYQKANQLLTTSDFEQAHTEALNCLTAYQKNSGLANSNYASILRLLQITSRLPRWDTQKFR
jgi:hypothetical protein